MKKFILSVCALSLVCIAFAQSDPAALLQKIKAKLAQVNDYQAAAMMKTNVSFLKVPDAQVTIYFKRPDHVKVKNDKGISLVPKSTSGLSVSSILEGNFSVVEGGIEKTPNGPIRIIKMIPADDNSDVVLSTLYIDENKLLVVKAKTTTREHGTFEVDLTYGKYAAYALPDTLVLIFNTKDYKLPKGLTFDYDDGTVKKPADGQSNSKGKVEITYRSYEINKGLADAIFKENKN